MIIFDVICWFFWDKNSLYFQFLGENDKYQKLYGETERWSDKAVRESDCENTDLIECERSKYFKNSLMS